jgi:hypothetical protein
MTSKSTSLRIARITKKFYELDPERGASRYLRTKGDFAVCARCCCFNQEKFALDDSWEIVADRDNTVFPFMLCDSCGQKILKLASK